MCSSDLARNGSVHGAITAIISWAEGVISLAEPPIVSEWSELGDAAGSGLLFPDSSSHNMDGLKSRSRKMFGGMASHFAPMRANTSATWLLSRATWWNSSPSNRADIFRTALR